MLQFMLSKLLILSISSTIVFLIFMSVFYICKKILTAKQKYYLLALPILLCLMPINLGMDFNLIQIKPMPTIQPNTHINNISLDQTAQVVTPILIKEQEVQYQIINEFSMSKYVNIVKNNLGYIWILGVLTLSICKLTIIIKFKKNLKKIAINPTKDMLIIFNFLNKNKRVKLKCFDGISTPFITGIFNPTIFMPNANIGKYEFSMALIHELTHIKRHDLVIKRLADFATVIHFFNPFIYVLKNKINTYCELSCDEAVTRDMDLAQCKDYGKMLLSLMKQKYLNLNSATCLSESKKNIKRRMQIIMKKNKLNKATIIIGLIIVFTLTAGAIVFSSALQSTNNKSMLAKAEGITNVLIIGCDSKRADSIMILSFDSENRSFSTLSIPRDTKVDANKSVEKISNLYAKDKNEQSTINAVEQITGLPINYYIVLNYEGFRNIVDILGGVEIDIPNDMNYEDPYQNLNISIKKGKQILLGKDAEGFVRFRAGYPDGDLTRIKNQQIFIKQLIEQKLNSHNLDKVPQIFKETSQNIKTNFNVSDIMDYVSILKMQAVDKVKIFSLPGNVQLESNSIIYFVHNETETKKLINNNFKNIKIEDDTL